MSPAEQLGKLIMTMNPYTKDSPYPMEAQTFVGTSESNGDQTSPVGSTATSSSEPKDMRHIWMEIDSRYPGEWSFKGQSHHVNKALRIAYRWATKDGVWVTDYLLVGYEGSNGG